MDLPATTILLIRHGRTRANREGIFRGRMDVPLDATGRGLEHCGIPLARAEPNPPRISLSGSTRSATSSTHPFEILNFIGVGRHRRRLENF